MQYKFTMDYYSVVKKEMKFAEKWLELEIVILYEITKTEKDKAYFLSYDMLAFNL